MSTATTAKTGTLNIHTENIFPIIKRFLYSDQEVFLRELIANAVDATQKLRTLSSRGEVPGELGDIRIRIALDAEAKTLTISDAGIGMTADEVEKYINQIAFSSAEEFLNKYQDDAQAIIGHFGLGFYSAFMVAERVELLTQSWQEDAEAVRWSCDGTTQFSLEPATREAGRGTDIILHIPEANEEFLQSWRIREILRKYARFLPIEIEFEGSVINDTQPLWTRTPNELTDDDYRQFYKDIYSRFEDPLFWVHLNVEHPFRLTGVLYFPKVDLIKEFKRENIQLYSNQVFVTDKVDDIVPEYLTLLHGVIDSPDIPLNVSRSALQADSQVKKISNHIAKKVAEKLQSLFREDRSRFEEIWPQVGVFVKYGMLRDDQFFDRSKEYALLTTVEDQHFTFDEFKARVQDQQTDKDNRLVYLYTTDRQAQHAYITAARKQGYEVLVLDGPLDTHLLSFLEMRWSDITLKRVDADTVTKLIDKGVAAQAEVPEAESEVLKALYAEVVGDANRKVEVQNLGEDALPVVLVRPEHMRRLEEMSRASGYGDGFVMPDQLTVVVNAAHALNRRVLLLPDNDAKRTDLARHSYDLARLSQQELNGAELSAFIERNVTLLG
jgi:molecular chaperone HtpG